MNDMWYLTLRSKKKPAMQVKILITLQLQLKCNQDLLEAIKA